MSAPDPNADLAIVLETGNRIELSIAEAVLEEAGIPFFVLGQIATLMQDVDPFLHKRFRLQVPADREVEARELLEHLPQPVATDDEGAAT